MPTANSLHTLKQEGAHYACVLKTLLSLIRINFATLSERGFQKTPFPDSYIPLLPGRSSELLLFTFSFFVPLKSLLSCTYWYFRVAELKTTYLIIHKLKSECRFAHASTSNHDYFMEGQGTLVLALAGSHCPACHRWSARQQIKSADRRNSHHSWHCWHHGSMKVKHLTSAERSG